MKLDNILKTILVDIQVELKQEEGVELSIEEIADVAKSQFIAALYGFSKGIMEVSLHKFGKFERVYKDIIIRDRKRVKEAKENEGKEAAKALRSKLSIAYNNFQKRRNKNKKSVTLEELHAMETINKIKLYGH